MLTRREVILAKIESTYGTDPTPAGTDAIAVANVIQANPAESARFAERNVLRAGSIGKLAPIFGGSLYGLQFDVEVKGAGALGVAPEWGVLLKACGFSETISASTSVTYAPTSGSGANTSCTIWYYQDGARTKLTGCRGNVSFKGTVGEVMILSFTMIGNRAVDQPADASLPSVTLDTTVPPTFMGLSFLALDQGEVTEFIPAFSELTFDMGNEVVPGANANATNGFGEIRIASRDVRGTIDPEFMLPGTMNFIDEWEQGVSKALAFTLGSSGGNRITVEMPRIQYIEPAFDDRDGTRVMTLGFKANESSSLNDEVSIFLD